jgi:Arc/MetJ family transcription regulator
LNSSAKRRPEHGVLLAVVKGFAGGEIRHSLRGLLDATHAFSSRVLDDAHKSNYICASLKEGQLMAHTNIDLDEKLLTEAMELTRARTKKEVIHLGLRELIRLARLRAVREYRGKFHWRGDLGKMREEETHEWRKPLATTPFLVKGSRNLRVPSAISDRDLFCPTIRYPKLQRFLGFFPCLWFSLGRKGHVSP